MKLLLFITLISVGCGAEAADSKVHIECDSTANETAANFDCNGFKINPSDVFIPRNCTAVSCTPVSCIPVPPANCPEPLPPVQLPPKDCPATPSLAQDEQDLLDAYRGVNAASQAEIVAFIGTIKPRVPRVAKNGKYPTRPIKGTDGSGGVRTIKNAPRASVGKRCGELYADAYRASDPRKYYFITADTGERGVTICKLQ